MWRRPPRRLVANIATGGVTPSEVAAASSNGPPLGPRESPIPTCVVALRLDGCTFDRYALSRETRSGGDPELRQPRRRTILLGRAALEERRLGERGEGGC